MATASGWPTVLHAGDGNLHPNIMFDINKPGELEKAEAAGEDILKLCVEVGGCLTGEHGVGIEKRDLMRSSSPRRTFSSRCACGPCSIRRGSSTRPRSSRWTADTILASSSLMYHRGIVWITELR